MAFGVVSPDAAPSLGAEAQDRRLRPQTRIGYGPDKHGPPALRDPLLQSRTFTPFDTPCSPSK